MAKNEQANLGSKITADGDCSHEIKRCLLLGRKAMTNLLLLLSHFSRVRLCATPQTAAYQAPPSLGFSRQEHWSGLPFPSPMHESEVAQSCPTFSDPMDCTPPGSSAHGIFQTNLDSILKKQRHYFDDEDQSSQSYGFSSSHIWMRELEHKES